MGWLCNIFGADSSSEEVEQTESVVAPVVEEEPLPEVTARTSFNLASSRDASSKVAGSRRRVHMTSGD
jgi:hypothetical protein